MPGGCRIVWEKADGSRIDFPLTADVHLVGREGEADIQMDEPLVSRNHARLEWRADAWVVLDLGSTNYTRVNGNRIGFWRSTDGGVNWTPLPISPVGSPYQDVYALYPAEYRGEVEAVTRSDGSSDSIVAAHSLIPAALRHSMSAFGAMLSPDLPLTRRQHEMIATVVSALNACFY